MRYGNPDAPNKHEQEASTVIHFVERQIAEYFRTKYGLGPGLQPGIRVDSQLYYAADGSPSRYLTAFVETPSGKRQLRFAVQRNVGARKWKWQLDFTDFVGGQSVNECRHEATAPIDMKPLITNLLDGYDFSR
jgi:hypothetical protein